MVDYRDFNDYRDQVGKDIHNTSSRSMAGPLVGLVAVVAILAAIFLFAGGGDNATVAPDIGNPPVTDQAPAEAPAITPAPADPAAPATPVQ